MRLLSLSLLAAISAAPGFGAEIVLPTVSFLPVKVSLVQDFHLPEEPADPNDQMAAIRRMYRRQESGCSVTIELSVPEGFKLLKVKPAVLIDGQTNAGEALSEPDKDKRAGSYSSQGDNARVLYASNRRFMPEMPDTIAVLLKPPAKPAVTVSSLRGSVDLVFGDDREIKHLDVKPVEGEAVAVTGVDGCDLAFALSANDITATYSWSALDRIRTVQYLDADGKPCQATSTSSGGMSEGKHMAKLGFSQPPVTIAVDCYSAIRAMKATFALKDIPLVGAAPDELKKPQPASEAVEIPLPEPEPDPWQGRATIQSAPKPPKSDF